MKYFEHSSSIWNGFPDLCAVAIGVPSISPNQVDAVGHQVEIARWHECTRERIFKHRNSPMPSIKAWQDVFIRMGYSGEKYCCASEQLLRRFRSDNGLPRINPLVDLCNAQSAAYGIPIAIFDVANITAGISVRPASGGEQYLSFANEVETPKPNEIVFTDESGHAHSRRWTYRQSRKSAVSDQTDSVLIVCEAHHATADTDIDELTKSLADSLDRHWHAEIAAMRLSRDTPRFEFQ